MVHTNTHSRLVEYYGVPRIAVIRATHTHAMVPAVVLACNKVRDGAELPYGSRVVRTCWYVSVSFELVASVLCW